jgi:hypothetical protein
MTTRKIVPIDYTSRDFNSIRDDLVEYVKRYYPNTYKDFNDASFGSLMLDTVSYVGDVLSFYLDYQANESFIETSIEFSNVVNHAKQMGYKYQNAPTSHGLVDLYVRIPADTQTTNPDLNYIPTLRRGTKFSTNSGKIFTLNEDVVFDVAGNASTVLINAENAEGPTFYAIKTSGQVVSGETNTEHIDVGSFQRFLRVEVQDEEISEIVSVTDSHGNQYYEVEYLSQNIVYREVPNRGVNSEEAASLIKPFPVPRRFVVEHEDGRVYLQFGYGSEAEIKNKSIVDPSELVLKVHGKNYVTDNSFDPAKLTNTDKFGVGPDNTTLTVKYRTNTVEMTNAAVGEISNVESVQISFRNPENTTESKKRDIISSLTVDNVEPIVGSISEMTTDEVKRRAIDVFATQNRAVTKRDYISCAYNMPSKFGAIKRCTAQRDSDELKRSINLYVLSETSAGKFIKCNSTIKNNLKTWLNSLRMMGDSIKILDGNIVNIGIEYDIMVENSYDEGEVLGLAHREIIADLLAVPNDLGEPFYITDVFKSLKDVEGVLDVVDVRVVCKTGANYRGIDYEIEPNTSLDGRYIGIPFDHAFEIRYPMSDIVGKIV